MTGNVENILLPYLKILKMQFVMIKNQNKKYECNLQILKVVIRAVLLCLKQSLPLHGDQENGKSDVTREKRTDEKTQRSDFHTAPNSFAMLDPMLDPISMLDFNALSDA